MVRSKRDFNHTRHQTIQRVFGFTIDENLLVAENTTIQLSKEKRTMLNTSSVTNSSFHNLLPQGITLPAGTRSLLGLGLKFCIEKPRPYQDICTGLQQFRNSINLCSYLQANGVTKDTTEVFNPCLYVKFKWRPPPCPQKLSNAVTEFENKITTMRKNLPTFRRFNLRPIYRRALAQLKKQNLVVCHPTNKGLGPYIIDRETYIKQILTERLTNDENYRQLSPEQANQAFIQQRRRFQRLFLKHKNDIKESVYFERSIADNPGQRPLFYALWKVHKQKKSICPVISSCGSMSEVFSIYTDECLRRLVQEQLLTYIISADQLVQVLGKKFPGRMPWGARLFSVDAVGMYNNIDTSHGIWVVKQFIRLYGDKLKGEKIPIEFVLGCLRLIMKNNIFGFGDTFWLQKNGAAMGTSCAVNYAFLYMGLLEMRDLLKDFSFWMPFYARFIDDGIGIWLTNRPGSARAWSDFQARLNSWGKLKWTNTGLVMSLEFLELRVTINNDNHFLEFQTFRKTQNLHLYISPHSAHPPDIIRSLIFSRVRAYYLHNTYQKDYVYNCYLLASYLQKRGWGWVDLAPHLWTLTSASNNRTKQRSWECACTPEKKKKK